MPLAIVPTEFLRQHNLPSDALEKTGLNWNDLLSIYLDHQGAVGKLEVSARYIVDQLRSIPEVHSLRYRVKGPQNLIAKIIRKKLDRPDFAATVDTYREVITDLVGIRALHLFKGEWLPIHRFVLATWNVKERPTANIRLGDSEEIFKNEDCGIHQHKAGYRSVHYLVQFNPTKEPLVAEVQVRTVFEEAWSEIDHRIRYPHAVDNVVLAQFLDMFNRLAGSADEMGTYVTFLQAHLSKKEQDLREATIKHDSAVAALEDAIARSKLDAKEKAALEKQVKELAAETKRTYGSVTGIGDFTVSGPIITAGVVTTPLSVSTLSPFSSGKIRVSVCERCRTTFTTFNDDATCPSCRWNPLVVKKS